MESFKVYISDEEDCLSPSSLPSVSPPSSPSSPPGSWLRGPLLGCGAFGSVSLAIDGTTGHLMAVKSVTASGDGDRQQPSRELQALENERQILQKVSSPRVIECYGADWSEENGVRSRNLLLELASGGSLANLLKKFNKGDGLDEILVRRFTRGIAEGLRDLHAHGIVHCDVKGQNVLLCKTGVKLCDFGASFQLDSPGSPGSSQLYSPPSQPLSSDDSKGSRVQRRSVNFKDARGCEAGVAGGRGAGSAKLAGTAERKQMKGTICWMAPEVVAEEGATPASDVWSLGCTVIEMLTGRPPWVSREAVTQNRQNPKSFMSVLYKIGCSVEVPEFPAGISAQGRDFLLKCLDRDPDGRWSAEDLLQHPFIHVASDGGESEAEDFNFCSSSPEASGASGAVQRQVAGDQHAACVVTDSFNVQPPASEPASGVIVSNMAPEEHPRPAFTMPPPLNVSFDFTSEPSAGLLTARGGGRSCFEGLSSLTSFDQSPASMDDSPNADATGAVDSAAFKLFDNAFASSFFSGSPSPHLISPLHEVARAFSAGSFSDQLSPSDKISPGSPDERSFPPARSAPGSFQSPAQPEASPSSALFTVFQNLNSREESSPALPVRALPLVSEISLSPEPKIGCGLSLVCQDSPAASAGAACDDDASCCCAIDSECSQVPSWRFAPSRVSDPVSHSKGRTSEGLVSGGEAGYFRATLHGILPMVGQMSRVFFRAEATSG
ncbi:hypothetical protein CLOM_g1112 [Closterium sp. NIES-68]|nr:hypothetical protein CLOM_g1112 [Closterium sp. NIES-68]GJP62105.1 hypothetical protein CLOP_g19200 [Closterium sp. NIES-67]